MKSPDSIRLSIRHARIFAAARWAIIAAIVAGIIGGWLSLIAWGWLAYQFITAGGI